MIRLATLILVLATVAHAQTIPPDITVAADGSEQFKTVQEAVASIAKDNRERTIIAIKPGTYREKVRIEASFVTLRGEGRDKTRIEFAQLNDEFQKNPDKLGRAVVNIEGDEVVLENLTIQNTAGVVGPHSFAIYGKGDRTVIVDCDVLSEGADTVSLWKGDTGRYYHARCNFRGAVDFVCPRGWGYVVDCTFFETKATAALWHDGSKNRDQKFVLRNCKFDGVDGWNLARHHHDAAFYLLDCTFSKSMSDRPPFRVRYPIGDKPTTQGDIDRNAELDKTNRWGERAYFFNCHRDGGDYKWHADNLATAEGSPKREEITAKWTFGQTWDPEGTVGPVLAAVAQRDGRTIYKFEEPVTVRGNRANYVSGSGSETLTFSGPPGENAVALACRASATARATRLSPGATAK
jgi:pectinesterase